jgi:hypothetical protein
MKQHDAEYNKRIASVVFKIKKNYYKCYEVESYPIGETFHVNANRIKAEAVCKFLNDMPLLQLDSFLRAKNVRFAEYLDGMEAA